MPRSPLLARLAGLGLVAFSIALAVIALVDARLVAKHRAVLLERLADAGVPEDGRVEVARETTPHHATLHAARALVYHALVALRREEGPERRRAVAALPEAERLAAEALRQQPDSWQAAMLLGTSIYLERSIARDRRLVTEAHAWESALEEAVRAAPGQPEPRRLLASAYLEIWPNLSAAKRARTKELLARVFRDDLRAFEALAPAWLGLGLGREETFSVVPEQPAAWDVLEKAYARADRFADVAAARERGLDALYEELEAELVEAEARLRLGDFFRARSMILRLVLRAPPSARFAPLVARALEVYPPGLHGLSSPERLEDWIEWALELDAVAVEILPPRAVGLLLDAVGEIEPPVAAHAALVARDPYQAERFEKLARPLTFAVWAPYLVAKARRLAEMGEVDTAREALAEVALGYRSTLPYALARAAVVRSGGDLRAPSFEAGADLASLRAERWGTLDWRWRRGRATIEMLPARAASGVSIDLEFAGDDGRAGAGPRAVVEVRIDGASVFVGAVGPGRPLRVDAEIAPRAHLLELRTLVGREVTPGDVALLGA